MTTEQLIQGRIDQMVNRQTTYNAKAESTNCVIQRMKMKVAANRCQIIIDEYAILQQQIKQNK